LDEKVFRQIEPGIRLVDQQSMVFFNVNKGKKYFHFYSRPKKFDSMLPKAEYTTNSEVGSGIIEHVTTFPNVTVNAGDEDKACVLTTKDFATHMYNRKYFICAATRIC
jgi:hypothetical protein